MLGEVISQLVDPDGDVLDADVVVVANVGRRAHRRDAVVLRLAHHREAVLEVERSVVETRQDVAVEVDHRSAAPGDHTRIRAAATAACP